jgi:hypothetical protein
LAVEAKWGRLDYRDSKRLLADLSRKAELIPGAGEQVLGIMAKKIEDKEKIRGGRLPGVRPPGPETRRGFEEVNFLPYEKKGLIPIPIRPLPSSSNPRTLSRVFLLIAFRVREHRLGHFLNRDTLLCRLYIDRC